MMQGCCTLPLPRPMVSPPCLSVKWVVFLFGLVAFPVFLGGLVSLPPLWSGACGLFGWPRPPVGGSAFYGGMVWLLPLVSSNVIVTCLLSSPLVGGSVLYRGVIVTCSLPYYTGWDHSSSSLALPLVCVGWDRWEPGRAGGGGGGAGDTVGGRGVGGAWDPEQKWVPGP